MKYLYFVLFILLIKGIASAPAQDNPRNIEELIDLEEDYQESEERIVYLEGLASSPVDLNSGTRKELSNIPGVSEFLASNVVNFRKEHGPFHDVSDLESVPGFLPALLEKISGYLTTHKPKPSNKPSIQFRSRVERQMETPSGVLDGSYQGPFYRQYSRLLWRYSESVEGSLVQERDPGEKRWSDYSSGYITFRGIPGNHAVTVGDFHVEAGQGLLLYGGRWFGFGNDGVYTVKRRPRGIRGNRSSLEYGRFRGVAIERNQPGIVYRFFRGWNKWDSNQDSNGNVTSFYKNGYHRTDLEISKRHNLRENVFGGYAGYYSDTYGRFGAVFISSDFDRTFVPSERDRFRFKGKKNRAAGVEGDFIWRSFNIFGEAAQSSGGATAAAGGILFRFGNAEFVGHIRRYDRDFHSFHGIGFGRRSSESRNENGVYAGGNIQLNSAWALSFYHDRYCFPWRTYQTPFPVRGRESMVYLTCKRSSRMTWGFRYKWRDQNKLTHELDYWGRKWDRAGRESRHQLRMNVTHTISRSMRLQSRLEGVWQEEKPDGFLLHSDRSTAKGIFIREDLRIQSGRLWRLYLRYGIFFSKDSPADFYMVRRDFQGIFSVVRMRGNGHIGTVLFTYRLKQIADISFKYMLVRYSGQKQLGSGRDEVNGPMKSYGGIQLDLQL